MKTSADIWLFFFIVNLIIGTLFLFLGFIPVNYVAALFSFVLYRHEKAREGNNR